jgi:hypothetical protein
MARSVEDDDETGADPLDPAARYWKRAAKAYSQACSSDAPEVKKLYMQVAMAWSKLADEVSREPARTIEVIEHHAKH